MSIPLAVLSSIALFSCLGSFDEAKSKFKKEINRELIAAKDKAEPPVDRVSVMTYNVENLFDWLDDDGKIDETYLPASKKNTKKHVAGCQKIDRKKWRDECLYLDWSEGVVRQKMKSLAQAVLASSENGPDILILQEVENMNVLKQWVGKHLQKAGYRYITLIEGADVRGIDAAVVSKFPQVGGSKIHPIPFEGMSQKRLADTRGILEVMMKLPGGEMLTVYANHFPAPYHPFKFRKQAFAELARIARKKGTSFQIAAGDFNVPSEENRKQSMLDKYVAPTWNIAHENCSDCKGTYYYAPKKEWSFLDMILVSKKSGWKVDPGSVNVIQEPFMLTQKGKPKSFSHRTGNGASDHLPLYVELIKK